MQYITQEQVQSQYGSQQRQSLQIYCHRFNQW
jgi:hypothetical protein